MKVWLCHRTSNTNKRSVMRDKILLCKVTCALTGNVLLLAVVVVGNWPMLVGVV